MFERATCGRTAGYELIKEWDDERESLALKKGKRETPLHLGGSGGFRTARLTR